MIECEDLTKQFDSFLAVDGISLNVQAGEVLAILGQNGAGKTTTVRMLTSILRPTRGWARIAGHDVVNSPAEVRALVGVLTEQHGLYGRMNAIEYLDFFGEMYKLPLETRRKRSLELLEYFGLGEAAKRRSGEYSKGMRQKLALARALIHEPPVLLLDEPTSAMDPESARLVRDHIAALRSSKRAIAICTHNLAEAEILADKVAIIHRGKILLQGTLEEIKNKVLGSAQFDIVFDKPDRRELPSLPAGVENIAPTPAGFRFTSRDPQALNPLVLKTLAENNFSVVTLQPTPRDLEQVYLKTMAETNGGLSQ